VGDVFRCLASKCRAERAASHHAGKAANAVLQGRREYQLDDRMVRPVRVAQESSEYVTAVEGDGKSFALPAEVVKRTGRSLMAVSGRRSMLRTALGLPDARRR
jgi:hypothetical protein